MIARRLSALRLVHSVHEGCKTRQAVDVVRGQWSPETPLLTWHRSASAENAVEAISQRNKATMRSADPVGCNQLSS
jgi:hypothetical protein